MGAVVEAHAQDLLHAGDGGSKGQILFLQNRAGECSERGDVAQTAQLQHGFGAALVGAHVDDALVRYQTQRRFLVLVKLQKLHIRHTVLSFDF